MFLCIGLVSAHENNTGADGDLSLNDNSQSHNIKDLIDKCEDNGTVQLEEDPYYLDAENETHIILNKTITVEGIEGKTIIDGNNTHLFLDVNETNDAIDMDTLKIAPWHDGYIFKNLGKNVTFKNIVFKDLTMTTWHEMTFKNCQFINTTFTSYEFENKFENCSFDKSTIEIVLFIGYETDIYEDYSKIMNCNIYESLITCKHVYTPYYISIVGSTPFFTRNSLDIINSTLCRSDIRLSNNNITIKSSNFNNTSFMGSSNRVNIENTNFNNQTIWLGLSEMNLNQSNITDAGFDFSGGYFGKGCHIDMENTILNNCSMEISPDYGSRKSSLKIKNSLVNNTEIESTDVHVLIDSSEFNKSEIEFFFSDAQIKGSTFINDGNITETIKTRNYVTVWVTDDNETFRPVKEECQVKTDYTVEDSYFINDSGKYEITYEDINMDTTYKIIINQSSVYYFNDKLIIRVVNYTGEPVSGLEIFIRDSNNYKYPLPSVKTDENGMASYTLTDIGNLRLYVYYTTPGMQYHDAEYGVNLNLTVNPTVTGIKITKVNFASNKYSKINSALKIKIIANASADLKGLKFAYKVYTNGKAKTYYSYANSNGITTFKIPKTLTAGSHKIEIRLLNTNIKKTMTVKIVKAKASVKAPNVVNKFKKSIYFKATVKYAKKAVKNVKVKIKVYTGKKYKTYAVKTNKNGIAKINTNKLKVGKHKVVISSGDSNYIISAESMITIRK